MFNHIVLFRLQDEGDTEEALRRLQALAEQVPVIRSLEAGRNLVPAERAYDVGLVVKLDSLDDLPAYANHPDHQALLAWIKPRVTGVAAVDFNA